jgi:hypothetical protein
MALIAILSVQINSSYLRSLAEEGGGYGVHGLFEKKDV